ncbi:MAG: hypothetical protein AAGL69_05960 [Pseudomonadota bacterium]
MLGGVLTVFAIAAGIVIGFLLTYGVPIYFIYREKLVPANEKLLWIVACVLIPWVPFLIFALIAPLTGVASSSGGVVCSSGKRRDLDACPVVAAMK